MIEIDSRGKIIKYDKEDLENKEEMIKHVSQNLDNYELLNDKLKHDNDIIVAGFNSSRKFFDRDFLKYIAKNVIKENTDILFQYLKLNYTLFCHLDQNLQDKLSDDMDFALEMKKCKYYLFRYLSENLRSNKFVIMYAIKCTEDPDFEILEYVPKESQDEDIVREALESNLMNISYANDKFIKKEMLLNAIKEGSDIYSELKDERFKNDKDIIELAISKDVRRFGDVPKTFKPDKKFLLTLKDPMAMEYISKDLLDDYDIVKHFIGIHGSFLRFASEKLRGIRELALIALKSGDHDKYWLSRGDCFCELSRELRKDKELALLAVKDTHDAYRRILGDLKYDRELALEYVKHKESNYCWIKNFLSDPELMLEFIKHDASRMDHIESSLYTNDKFIWSLIKIHPFLIGCINRNTNKYRYNRDLAMLAVSIDGSALRRVDDKFKDDYEVVMTAIKNDKYMTGDNIEYASERLKKDKTLGMIAVENYGLSLEFLDDGLKNNEDIVMTACKNRNGAIKYASKKLQNDEKFRERLIKECACYKPPERIHICVVK